MGYPLGRDFYPMDSAFQQMYSNLLYNYQQNLLNCPVNSDCMVDEIWCKNQEIHTHSDSLIYIDSHSQALFLFTKITVHVQD